MSSSAISTQVAQLKIGNVQNQADTSAVYNAGNWSFKNSTALTSVTITDAGNVGIGTASPATTLHLNAAVSNAAKLRVSRSTSDSNYIQLGTNGGDSLIIANGVTGTAGSLVFANDANTGSATERMRIDTSGNVGIGTASPSSKFEVKDSSTNCAGTVTSANSSIQLQSNATDGYMNMIGAGNLIFRVGNPVAERMRIDASGRLMVGATSSDYIFRANGFSHFGDAYDAGQYGAIQISRPQATSNKFHLACISSGLQVCGLGFLNNSNVFAVNNAASSNSNGVSLANGGTSWSPLSSDIRKKKNFETTQGLAEVLQIEPVKYHLLDDEDMQPKRLGFKAQNLQPLIPEMVIPNGQKAEDGSDYLTITPDYLLPVLVKAIQEQQAQIETLKAEVAALKAP